MEQSLFRSENEKIAIQSYRGKNVVSGRELHEKLGIKSEYKDWFRRMKDYGFEDGKDFFLAAAQKRAAGGNIITFKNHHLTLDMAKEICMIQRTPIGREFRQYFIEAEKQLRGIYQLTLPFENSSRVLENAAKYALMERHPSLSVQQVETLIRLMPLYPQIRYSEIGKICGIKKDTLRNCRIFLEGVNYVE